MPGQKPKSQKPQKPAKEGGGKSRSRIANFNGILDAILDFPAKRVAVAVAQDPTVLEAVTEAHEKNVAEYVLVGNRDEILRIADDIKKDVSPDTIINVQDPIAAANEAVRQVHDGFADVLMKGYIHTDDFLRAVLDKDYPAEDYIRQFSLRVAKFLEKLDRIERIFAEEDEVPDVFTRHLNQQRERLKEARRLTGKDIIAPQEFLELDYHPEMESDS